MKLKIELLIGIDKSGEGWEADMVAVER